MKSVISALAVAALSSATAGAMDYVPGQVIVKYKADAVRTYEKSNKLYDKVGAKDVEHFSGIMEGFELLKLVETVKLEDAITDLQADETVEYAHPNFIVSVQPTKKSLSRMSSSMEKSSGFPCIPGFEIPGCDPDYAWPCLIPGIDFPPGCSDGKPSKDPELMDPPDEVDPPVADPSLDEAYGLKKISATDAWDAGYKGAKEVVVAVIDTGVDYNHEDLSYNVWRNPKVGEENDLVGYDFVHKDGLPFDDQSHGTHTSGTVGAVGGNGKGVSGVNQRVSIMALKFLNGKGQGTLADGVLAIDYAAQHGAKVISASWGGRGSGDEVKALFDAIERAKDVGLLFVAAAGNESADNDNPNEASYPAALENENLIAVAATDSDDKLAKFSNYGKTTVDVGAPGVNVLSTIPGNEYKAYSGTSMACPHVAGAAALVWSKNPDWTWAQVKEALLKTADPVASLKGKTLTGGRINLKKALEL